MRVLALPAQALVDVNSAPRPLLAQLWRRWRECPVRRRGAGGQYGRVALPSGGGRRGGQFDVVEDVLRVEGMTRTRLDAVRHFISAGQRGGGDATPRPASAWRSSPRSRPPRAGPAAAWIPRPCPAPARRSNARSASRYRVDAIVSLGGRQWLRRRWIATRSGTDSRLPWRTERAEIRAGGGPRTVNRDQQWTLFGYDTRQVGQHWLAAWRDLLWGDDSPLRQRLDEVVLADCEG